MYVCMCPLLCGAAFPIEQVHTNSVKTVGVCCSAAYLQGLHIPRPHPLTQ